MYSGPFLPGAPPPTRNTGGDIVLRGCDRVRIEAVAAKAREPLVEIAECPHCGAVLQAKVDQCPYCEAGLFWRKDAR